MAIGGGMSCVKYLLFCFNLLFAITGMIILIVGIKAEINAHPYISLTDERFWSSAPVILIIVGIIVFIVAFFGCCGAVKENHCMIVTFSVLLLLIFLAELGVGIAGYMKHKDLETDIIQKLNQTIKEYDTNPDIQKNYDIVQTDLQCCGVHGPADWSYRPAGIPNSCCSATEIINATITAPCNNANPNLHLDGCLSKVSDNLKAIAILLGGVGLGIAMVQLLGVVSACCLARSIRNQYETV